MKDLKDYVRSIPDFPKPGIIFRDITTLINDADGFQQAIDDMCEKVKDIESEIETVMIEEFNLDQNPISDLKESSDAFDLDEAINPKETLEDICRELGLI